MEKSNKQHVEEQEQGQTRSFNGGSYEFDYVVTNNDEFEMLRSGMNSGAQNVLLRKGMYSPLMDFVLDSSIRSITGEIGATIRVTAENGLLSYPRSSTSHCTLKGLRLEFRSFDSKSTGGIKGFDGIEDCEFYTNTDQVVSDEVPLIDDCTKIEGCRFQVEKDTAKFLVSGCKGIRQCSMTLTPGNLNCGIVNSERISDCDWKGAVLENSSYISNCSAALYINCNYLTASDAYGAELTFGHFYNCKYLVNCLAPRFSDCWYLINCKGFGYEENNSNIPAFDGCRYLSGCCAELQNTQGPHTGFLSCENLENCRAVPNIVDTGFWSCNSVRGCVFDVPDHIKTAYGFRDCNGCTGNTVNLPKDTALYVKYINCFPNFGTEYAVDDTAAGGFNVVRIGTTASSTQNLDSAVKRNKPDQVQELLQRLQRLTNTTTPNI